eukprot:10848188-Alexandrium_andersonii.AAC.1
MGLASFSSDTALFNMIRMSSSAGTVAAGLGGSSPPPGPSGSYGPSAESPPGRSSDPDGLEAAGPDARDDEVAGGRLSDGAGACTPAFAAGAA